MIEKLFYFINSIHHPLFQPQSVICLLNIQELAAQHVSVIISQYLCVFVPLLTELFASDLLPLNLINLCSYRLIKAYQSLSVIIGSLVFIEFFCKLSIREGEKTQLFFKS